MIKSQLRRQKIYWDRIEGDWKQLKGNIKQQWGKLTDDQLDVIAGKRKQLAGKIQEIYGITKGETEKQIADWQARPKDKPPLTRSKKASYEVSVAKAEADCAAAKEKCDDAAGAAKGGCVTAANKLYGK